MKMEEYKVSELPGIFRIKLVAKNIVLGYLSTHDMHMRLNEKKTTQIFAVQYKGYLHLLKRHCYTKIYNFLKNNRNLRTLAIELFKVFKDFSPVIFAEAFPVRKQSQYNMRNYSCFTTARKTIFPKSRSIMESSKRSSTCHLSINFWPRKRPYFPSSKRSKHELFSNQ